MAHYIYGKNTVRQYLTDGSKIEELYLQKNSRNEEFAELARSRKIRVSFLSQEEMGKIAKGNHQGVAAAIADYRTYTLNEVLDKIRGMDRFPLFLMLDGIEDPHNLGAILRTCDATGVDAVIIRKHRAVGLNATVAKVSSGAIDTVCVAEVANLTDTIKTLKKEGFWICGADNNEARDYRKADYRVPLCLVIGSEGSGISQLVKKNLDYSVKLPMVGKINSLNASVATAVMLYEILNQRNPV